MTTAATISQPTYTATALPASGRPPSDRPDAQVEDLQKQIQDLQSQIDMMRRRDTTLQIYMDHMDEEMRLAARLQQDFLPKTMPELGPVRFHALFRPARYVSGDLYDVLRLDEKHVGVYLADAVGHGVAAALLTMFIKRALVTKQILPPHGYRLLQPSETMGRLNAALVEQDLPQASFATAIYALIDTQTLQATFARGGHPHPILLRGSDSMHVLEGKGTLLGVSADEQYPDWSVQLSPGDRLFLYTDGIEVAFNQDRSNNTEQWRNELYRRRTMPTEQLLSDFARHIDHEWGSLQPKDDLTIVVVEVIGS